VPDLVQRCAPDAEPRTVAEHDGVRVAVTIARPELMAEVPAPAPAGVDQAAWRAGPDGSGRAHTALSGGARASSPPPARSAEAVDAEGLAASLPSMPIPPPPVAALSYTSLQQHARCGYRFYLERVLGIPATDESRVGASGRVAGPDPCVRGRIVHSILERVDFVRPEPPDAAALLAEAERSGAALSDAAAQEIADLVAGFLDSDLARRLGAIRHLRREQPFALRLAGLPLVGVFDAIGSERSRTLVVDYKSDRLGPEADPAQLAAGDYALQRAAYALAALRDSAREVEVVHVFLERSHEPASTTYAQADLPRLEAELQARADAVLRRDFPVAPDPGPRVCDGCPGRGSLCSWPLERTLGAPSAPEGRLF